MKPYRYVVGGISGALGPMYLAHGTHKTSSFGLSLSPSVEMMPRNLSLAGGSYALYMARKSNSCFFARYVRMNKG